jgi:dihydrodipicolinate synthase/N-acetylneuraminate lyase
MSLLTPFDADGEVDTRAVSAIIEATLAGGTKTIMLTVATAITIFSATKKSPG